MTTGESMLVNDILSNGKNIDQAIRSFTQWCKIMKPHLSKDIIESAYDLIKLSETDYHIQIMVAFMEDVYRQINNKTLKRAA